MKLTDFNWLELLTKQEYSMQDMTPALNHLAQIGYPINAHTLNAVEEEFCDEIDAMNDYLKKINYWNQPDHLLSPEDNPKNRDVMFKNYIELFGDCKTQALNLLNYLSSKAEDFGPEYDDNIEHEN